MIIDDASDSETGSISSDEDFIPTENILHETEKSMNRHHPALKLNNKQNKIFEYTGPHLIIDPQYYELPELLLSKLQRSLTCHTP